MEVKRPDDLVDYRAGHTPRYWSHSPKKVALVGMGPSITDFLSERLTQEAAPDFADEIWAINMVAMTLWHDLVIWMDDLYDQEAFKPGLMAELRRHGKPVITAKSYPEIVPTSYDYPIDEIAKMSMHYFGKPYLNNGVAQAIAYAMYRGVETFKMYGCDFTYPNREIAESGRACTESWLTLANTQGMEIQISPNTSIYDAVSQNVVYGYKGPLSLDIGEGKKYEYLSPAEAERRVATDYVPEDSSGAPVKEEKDEPVSASVSGANGACADDDGRRVGSEELNHTSPAAPAIGASSESVRHSSQSGSNQVGDTAVNGGGGTAGPVSRPSNGSGSVAPRIDRSGRTHETARIAAAGDS